MSDNAVLDPHALVSMSRWGKDHWSTLAYIETVMVNCEGFQVGSDPRMKANRRNFRVLAQECPNPRRATRSAPSLAMVMRPEHATRLRDGTVMPNHDDWECLQDFAAEGLFAGAAQVEPKKTLQFSARGLALAADLRAYKAQGGQFANFEPTTPAPAVASPRP